MAKSILSIIIMSCVCVSAFGQRIVTAGSAITETVCALGECSKIVASDKTSLYPAEIQSLPSIGYRSSISSEGIISLKPTLVIAEKDYVDESVLAQVKSAGIKTIVVERSYSVEGTRNLIREIATALNKKAEGEKIIAKIESEIAEAATIVKRSGRSPRVLCVYNRGTSSFDAAGTKTFSEILPYVGARSAIDGVNGYKPLNTEAMIAANPDFMLLFESGLKSLGGIDGVLNVPGVAQTRAGKERKIVAIDGIKLSNFGPRFGEAVKELAVLLHPEIKQSK